MNDLASPTLSKIIMNARVCHSGTECMPHGVRRHHIGQRFLVAFVVLLGKALEHGVIVDGGFGPVSYTHLDVYKRQY